MTLMQGPEDLKCTVRWIPYLVIERLIPRYKYASLVLFTCVIRDVVSVEHATRED